MKKKKGLSLEDKRQILMSLFKKGGSFYHYKEIEKHCTQNKISYMIVKDLLKGIVGDNLVETEKIGSSAYYWSLPNRVYDALKQQKEREKQVFENLTNDINNVNKKIEDSKAMRIEDEKRKKNKEKMAELNEVINENLKILKDFEDKDPDKYEKYKDIVKKTDRLDEFWIDNIWSLHQWMRSKRPDIDFEKCFPMVQELHLFE